MNHLGSELWARILLIGTPPITKDFCMLSLWMFAFTAVAGIAMAHGSAYPIPGGGQSMLAQPGPEGLRFSAPRDLATAELVGVDGMLATNGSDLCEQNRSSLFLPALVVTSVRW